MWLERDNAGCPPTVLQTQSLGWFWINNPPSQLLAFHASLLPTNCSNVSKSPPTAVLLHAPRATKSAPSLMRMLGQPHPTCFPVSFVSVHPTLHYQRDSDSIMAIHCLKLLLLPPFAFKVKSNLLAWVSMITIICTQTNTYV